MRHAVLRRRVRSVSVVPARAARASTRPGAHLFHPSRFSERVAKRWGRVALEGRAPPTRRTIRTDAPGPPNPSVIPSGAPRASHDRRRTSSGPRAPRREVRPLPKLFPSPHGHLGRRGRLLVFFSALAPSPFPAGARAPAGSDRPRSPVVAQGNIFRGVRPRATTALARGASRLPTPVRPNGPHFFPFEFPPDARAGPRRVPRLTLRPGAAAPRGRPRPPRRYPSHPRPLEPSPRGFDTLAPGLPNPARPTRGAARRRARPSLPVETGGNLAADEQPSSLLFFSGRAPADLQSHQGGDHRAHGRLHPSLPGHPRRRRRVRQGRDAGAHQRLAAARGVGESPRGRHHRGVLRHRAVFAADEHPQDALPRRHGAVRGGRHARGPRGRHGLARAQELSREHGESSGHPGVVQQHAPVVLEDVSRRRGARDGPRARTVHGAERDRIHHHARARARRGADGFVLSPAASPQSPPRAERITRRRRSA